MRVLAAPPALPAWRHRDKLFSTVARAIDKPVSSDHCRPHICVACRTASVNSLTAPPHLPRGSIECLSARWYAEKCE